MTGIFISYREDDAKPWALMLAEDLVEAFGKEFVFLDKDRLHAGRWRDQITQALDHAKVVLVVIGRNWVSITDQKGQRRLDIPNDVHRQEVALALSHKGVTVIPVRVDKAPMPRPEELPADIRQLTEQQSRELSDDSARRTIDLRQLIEDIAQITGLQPTDSKSKRIAQASTVIRSLLSIGPLVITAVISVPLLAIIDLGLGWSLVTAEKSFIVVLVFLTTLTVSRWRKHSRRKK